MNPVQTLVPGAAFQVITLTTGEQAYVDTADFSLVARLPWYLSCNYASTGQPQILMHHLILDMYDFSTHELHHINENELDNRRSNLKVLTFQQHIMTKPAHKDNASGFKGVTLSRATGRYFARIMIDGKNNYLGMYKSPEDAARAYDRAAFAAYGDIAHLNFPRT